MTISRAKAYFSRYGVLYGCSEKPGSGDYYVVKFDSMEKALEWWNREEYDFREREFIGRSEALELNPAIDEAGYWGRPVYTASQVVYRYAMHHVAPWQLAEMVISSEQAASILDNLASGADGDDYRILPDDLTPEKFIEIFDRAKKEIDPWHI